jgi:sterol desaturase/sphingolipid hydroxylase (fatty acid hydroxylase superfamily)
LSSSVFNYWFGYVSNLLVVTWLISRAFTPGVARLSPLGWVAAAGGGLLLWTLMEYFLHKWLYHDIESPIRDGHTLHHEEPHALLGVPWYFTAVVIVGVYYGLAKILDPASTAVVMAFTWLGYIGYCAMHHMIHHSRMTNAWFMNLRRHHLLHHAKNNVNWGITTDFWDKVFRTKV